MDGGKCVGAIVCKLDMHKKMVRRGYIAMLAVDSDYRRRKIGIVFWSFVNNICNQNYYFLFHHLRHALKESW